MKLRTVVFEICNEEAYSSFHDELFDSLSNNTVIEDIGIRITAFSNEDEISRIEQYEIKQEEEWNQ